MKGVPHDRCVASQPPMLTPNTFHRMMRLSAGSKARGRGNAPSADMRLGCMTAREDHCKLQDCHHPYETSRFEDVLGYLMFVERLVWCTFLGPTLIVRANIDQ